MRTAIRSVAIAAVLVSPMAAPAQASPCCGITRIDAATGIVTAAVAANGQEFQFKVTDARALAALKVGQQVFANFGGKQVSLDGRRACCTITSGPSAPASAAPPTSRPTAAPSRAPSTAPRTAPNPRASSPAASSPSVANLPSDLAITAARVNTLPTVTVGPPQLRTTPQGRATSRFQVATVTTQVAGRSMTAPVLHLRGLKAVTEAPGLPPGAQRLLQMLVRRVPMGQSDHYIVNAQLAREWVAAHPVPDNVKPTEPKEKKCGNWYDSWDCAGQAVNDEWERTFDHASDEWEGAKRTLSDAWETSVECFEERTISAGDIPVRFDITPSMTVDLAQRETKGGTQTTVAGSATLGVPMQSDAAARLELFYIPCLPFAVRPKALSATGVLTVGQELKTSVSATGRFDRTFNVPPSGGWSIPIQVYPIIIGGVPVAVLDVSAYIEGEFQVSTEGRAEGQFQIKSASPTDFEFSCSGSRCVASSRRAPASTTTNQSAQINGIVSVKPAIYTALELNFNYEALTARAGPQPYLLGTASGCAAAAGAQSSDGGSTVEQNHVLSADLDWGVELRAEALVLNKPVGESYRTRLMQEKHLWFRDLAPGGSTALVASVLPAGPAVAAKRTDHKVQMPSCYPYTQRVKYQVSWTGGATPAPDPARGAERVSPCSWDVAQRKGTCSFDPHKPFVIGLVWPTPGTWSLTVAPVGDVHDRVFAPPPAVTKVEVTVVP